MCSPTLATAALSGANYVQQSAQANKLAKFQADVFDKNAANAKASALSQYESLNIQRAQEEAQTAALLQDAEKQSLQAQASAKVAAGEAGVGGGAVNAVVQDLARQEAEFRSRTLINDRFRALQLENAKQAVNIGTQQAILAGLPSPVFKPNPFQIAADTASSYFKFNPPDKG